MENFTISITKKTYQELKEFLSTLSEEQLCQPIKIVITDAPVKYIGIFDILNEDHINPSGEMAEPKSMYAPGSPHLEEDDNCDYSDEPIVAYKGDVFLHIYE